MDLAALWAEVKQAPDHATRRALLCGPLAAELRMLDATSLDFESVFGTDHEVLATVCRTVVQDARDAAAKGFPLALATACKQLNSFEHVTLLMLLGSLVDVAGAPGAKSRVEAVIRVLALHNVPQHLCLLHECYVEVVEHGRAISDADAAGMHSWAVTPGDTTFAGSDVVPNLESVVVSPEVVAAAQRQLSTLSTLLRTCKEVGLPASAQALAEDMFTHSRVAALVRTFPSHMHFPHSNASSLCALAQDVLSLVIGARRLPGSLIMKCVDELLSAFRFNFDTVDVESAGRNVPQVSAALEVQRLLVLEQLLLCLHTLLVSEPAASDVRSNDSFDEMTDFTGAVKPEAIEYNAIANALLLLQVSLSANSKIAERVFDAFLRIATVPPRMAPPPAAKPVAEGKSRSASIARFFSKALSAPQAVSKSVVRAATGAAAHTDPKASQYHTVVHIPQVVEAANSFVVCCVKGSARQCLGHKVLGLVSDVTGVSMPASVRLSVLVTALENLRNFDAGLQVAIVSAFSSLLQSPDCSLSDHIASLVSALHARSVTYECASSVLSLLTAIAGNHRNEQPELRGLVLEHGAVPVVLSLIEFLATKGTSTARYVYTVPTTSAEPSSDGHDDSAASPVIESSSPDDNDPRTIAIERWNQTLLTLLRDFWVELMKIPASSASSHPHSVFTESTTFDRLVKCVACRNGAGNTACDMLVAISGLAPAASASAFAVAMMTIAPSEGGEEVGDLDLDEATAVAEQFWDIGHVVFHVLLEHPQCQAPFAAHGGLDALLSILKVFAQHPDDLIRTWDPRCVCLSVLLALIMEHVRFARDAETALFEAIAEVPPEHTALLQMLLDLASGQLVSSTSIDVTRQWISAAAMGSADSDALHNDLRSDGAGFGQFTVPASPDVEPLWAPLEVAMDVLCDRVFGTDTHPVVLDEELMFHLRPAIMHVASGLRAIESPSFSQAVLRRALPSMGIAHVAHPTPATIRQVLSDEMPSGVALSILTALVASERSPPSVTFVEGGNAELTLNTSQPFPRKALGFAMGGWVKWNVHVSGSPRPRGRRQASDVPLWCVRFGEGLYGSFELLVDPVADESVIRLSTTSQKAEASVPLIEPGVWTHVAFAVEQVASSAGAMLTFYVNGAAATRVQCRAMADAITSIQPDERFQVRLGFPADQSSGRASGRAVSFGSTVVFESSVGPSAIARLFSADRDLPVSPSLTQQVVDLRRKDHLTDRELRLVVQCCLASQASAPMSPRGRDETPSTLQGATPLSFDTIQDADPVSDADVAAIFFPADVVRTRDESLPLPTMGNARLTVMNGAPNTKGRFLVHSPHYALRSSRSIGHTLAATGGHSALLAWLDDAVSDNEPEIAAAALRCIRYMAERCDFDRVTGRAAWYAVVKLLFAAGRTISEAVVLRELLGAALRQPDTAAANLVDAGRDSVLASIAVVEHALLRWELISYLPPNAAMMLIDSIGRLVSPENPFRTFNAQRLLLASIATHFSYGMSRSHVDAGALLAAGSVLEQVLVAAPDPAPAVSELLGFLAMSVPVGGNVVDCAQHLVTALPIEPCVATVRNVVLLACVRAVRRRGDYLASVFATHCPTWWLCPMTDRHAGPITVSLSLQLFGLMLSDASFAKRARKASLAGLLMKSCQPYSHQPDVLDALARVSVGVACFPTATDDMPLNVGAPACDVAYLPALLRCVRALATATVDDDAHHLLMAPTTNKRYFNAIATTASYKPSRLRSAAMSVFAVACFKSTRRDKADAKPPNAPLRIDSEIVTPEESDRRLALVQHVLSFVGSLVPNNTVLECFTATVHPCSMSEVAWLLFSLVPPAPAAAESAMLRQATQDECALVIVDSSDDESEVASPGRVDHDGDDAALAASSSLSLQKASSTFWSVNEVEKCAARHAESLIEVASGFIADLAVAVASSNSSPVSLVASTLKGPPIVGLLHHLINACPSDVTLFARQWYQSKLLTIFFTALHTAIAKIPRTQKGSSPSEPQTHLLRSSVGLAVFAVERLTAALPGSPGDTITFVNAVHYELSRHNPPLTEFTASSARLVNASIDWALYALSPCHHGWSRKAMIKACEAIVDYSSLVFASSLPADGLRSMLPRLAEVSLGILVDYDSSTAPEGKTVGTIWYKLFHTCRDSPLLTTGLVDSSGSQRNDLLHGGFDILYREYDPIGQFTGWFADCRYTVAAFFRKNYGKNSTKFLDAQPLRHSRGAGKAESMWQLGSMQADMRANELATTSATALDRALESATLVEQSLVSLRTSTSSVMYSWLSDPPIIEPLATPAEESQNDRSSRKDRRREGFLTYDPPSAQLFLSPTSDCGVRSGTLVAAMVPVFGSGLMLPPIEAPQAGAPSMPVRELITCAPGKATLSPAAQLLLTRVLGPGTAPIHYIGNVYILSGADAHIAVLCITQTELIFITMAQYIHSTQDIAIAQPQEHDAASKRQSTRAFVTNMLRRFLPSGAQVSNRVLSAETEGGFRFSQYYRQIKAEATRSGRTDDTPRIWRFSTNWITGAANRSYQHQRAALEIKLESREAWFFVVLDEELTMRKVERDRVASTITSVAPWVTTETTSSMRARVSSAQRLWLRKQISTMQYLLLVNEAGSRTPCDVTQYPVVPWVLPCSDAPPASLDGDENPAPGTIRDLTKPIGATNPQRFEEVQMRYQEWFDEETPPFHHGTHYSSSAVVNYFLVRLTPFTSQSSRYQGGRLDVADRLFHSLCEAWQSSTGARGGDCKELIPELFNLPELVANDNNVALGTRRDGIALGQVQLPTWARTAHKFCEVHRYTLESDAVGAAVNSWIDLVFGSKQQGDEAVAVCNVFHHVSYERGLQRAMEAATSEESRKAIVAQVENFGLTPRMAFKGPHPRRPANQPTPPKQNQFLNGLATLTERPTRTVVRHQRATAEDGGPLLMREFDSMLFCCTKRHVYTASRPLQVLEWRGRCDVSLRTRDDDLVTVLPSVLPYGEGDVAAICTSSSSHIACVATVRCTIFVFTRSSVTADFALQAVLRTPPEVASKQRAVTLRMFYNSTLVAVFDNRFIATWSITTQRTRFMSCADSLKFQSAEPTVSAEDIDYGQIVGIAIDARDDGKSGLLHVAFEWGVVLLSRRGLLLASASLRSAAVSVTAASPTRQRNPAAPAPSGTSSLSDSTTNGGLQHLNGTQRLRVMSSLQEPFTCITHVGFPTYSPQEVLVAGHADGSLSFWMCQSVTSPADPVAFRIQFFTMVTRSDGLRASAATAIAVRGDRSIAVAYDDGTVTCFHVPAVDSETL